MSWVVKRFGGFRAPPQGSVKNAARSHSLGLGCMGCIARWRQRAAIMVVTGDSWMVQRWWL